MRAAHGVLVVALTLLAAGAARAGAPPVSPGATPATEAVLRYLHALGAEERPGTIAGQNCGHGNEIVREYDALVGRLQQTSGKWAALIGVDYEYARKYRAPHYAEANAVLINHWNAGGLVTVNATPLTPFDPMGTVKTPHTHDLALLLDPASPFHKEWMTTLDRWAAALKTLADAGVVVLWRPMQEMNRDDDDAFWYSRTYASAEGWKRVWRHMFEHFTKTRGLKNLLWVYSPTVDFDGCTLETYPGDDVVDIVAPTSYADDLTFWGYNRCVTALRASGKALGWAEMGHAIKTADGSFDMRRYADALAKVPRVSYFVAWHSWTAAKMAIVDNQNATALMGDARLITRERVAWREHGMTPDGGAPPDAAAPRPMTADAAAPPLQRDAASPDAGVPAPDASRPPRPMPRPMPEGEDEDEDEKPTPATGRPPAARGCQVGGRGAGAGWTILVLGSVAAALRRRRARCDR